MMKQLTAEYAATLKECQKLGDEMSRALQRAKETHDFSDYKDKQRRLAKLKAQKNKISEEIWKLRQATRKRHFRREKAFIDLARKRLGEEAYRDLWSEVDRLENAEWADTWRSDPGTK